MMQSVLPLSFNVPSAHDTGKVFHPCWDGTNWSCDCQHYKRFGNNCRHILEKRLEMKGRGLFSGVTVEPMLDEIRLVRQYKRVFSVMCDGEWRTLSEVALETCDPLQSISARLRDFRKARFGGHVVDRRRRGDDISGLFEYRLIVNEKSKMRLI